MRSRVCIFFFSSRRRHTRSTRDWSSDVCSSDLGYYQLGWFPGGGRIDTFVAPPPPRTGLYVVDSLLAGDLDALRSALLRSEERRVGKECRARWSPGRWIRKAEKAATIVVSSDMC